MDCEGLVAPWIGSWQDREIHHGCILRFNHSYVYYCGDYWEHGEFSVSKTKDGYAFCLVPFEALEEGIKVRPVAIAFKSYIASAKISQDGKQMIFPTCNIWVRKN